MQEPNVLTMEKIGTIVIPGHVPSINDYIHAMQKHRLQGAKFEQEWKQVGFLAARNWCIGWQDNGHFGDSPWLCSQVHVVVKVYRKNNIRRDIHNLYAKPLLDGFTQAGVWTDDNEKVMPKVSFEYCGLDRDNPRVEFEIYQEVQIG